MFFIAEKTCGKHNVSKSFSWTWFLWGGKATLLVLWCVLFEVAWAVCDTLLDAPSHWLQNTPTNSCGICTSLNLIYLRPLWEQRNRPSPGSHAPIFTYTRTHAHFPFHLVSGCPQTTHLHLYLCFFTAYLSLICSLSAPCYFFSPQNIPSLPNTLSFISHPAVEWYWERDDMAVLFLSSGWCIINAYSHRHAATDLEC